MGQSLDWLLRGKIASEVVHDELEEALANIDLSELSEEELAALIEATDGAYADQGYGDEDPEDPEEIAEKLSSASEFLGRVQAHAFMDEWSKLSNEASAPREKVAQRDIPGSNLAAAIASLARR